ncbi:putative rnf5 [Hibiscus syriacus]|uniref:RNA polymerase II transcription factor B subunit 2 n=1 Tax=Hibiscus syriacus TaxID=106335 RepID=A0A6A3BLJ0_HIBSY|nr:putative rnf5 [Hibiscus syriacus]
MPQVKIIAKNFMDMVASLPAIKLDMLYRNQFICEAILRSLPPLAKKYVLQMLYIDAPITSKSLQEWVLADGSSKHKVAIDRLIQLRVFEVIDRKKETTYKLNPTFQTSLRKHLIYGGILPREPMPPNVIARLPTLEELDAYALEQWECFLLQLISSGQTERSSSFSSSMMRIFQRGLLRQRDKEAPRLTESGFQFLLMDTNAQLWYVIREYISNSEEQGVDQADLIAFLLELSFHTTGEAYNLDTLTDGQTTMIKDLADLGLVKLQKGRKDSWFIPTKLATNLSVSLADTTSRKQGFVVVETNFRMYSYSSSKLHCEILRLFSRVEYQLPNLIVGSMTKESLYNAFENGITAEQIVTFLQQNAHPRVAEKVPSVPENVTDQIRLWESDLKRVEMTPAHFYDEFPSRDVFEAASDFARMHSGLLWDDAKKMRLVVKGEIHILMPTVTPISPFPVFPNSIVLSNIHLLVNLEIILVLIITMASILKSCMQFTLKSVNLIMAMVGIAMILYGFWMLRVWHRDMSGSSYEDLDYTAPWSYPMLEICVRAALLFCSMFTDDLTTTAVLLLIETGITADILLNEDWEKDIPDDPTGRFRDFKQFVETNIDIFKWIFLIIFLGQGLSVLLAMALRAFIPTNQCSNYDSDKEFTQARQPLINNHAQKPAYGRETEKQSCYGKHCQARSTIDIQTRKQVSASR